MWRNGRESRLISQQQEKCLGTIMSIQDYYHLSDHKKLIKIILNRKDSQKLFLSEKTMVSSMFDPKNPEILEQEKILVFAQKYTFEQLVEKYPRPKAGTNDVLISILRKKMESQIIMSHQTRKNIWLLASGAKFALHTHKGLYENLVNYTNYPSYFEKQIDLDLTRTVGKNSLNSNIQLKALKNMLISFARRNPYIGYCQGLNFIAYFILTMQFTQQEAFWLLSQITETIIPMDYYTNMIGVVCDQQIFIEVLRVLNPRITQKFRKLQLNPSVLSIQWFVCLFASSLPFYLAKLVWDRLLIQGTSALIKTGIIIMGYFQEQILSAQQFDQVIMIVDNNSKNLQVSEEQFNQQYQKIYINTRGLKIARELYREYHIMQKLAENQPINRKRKQQALHCEISWPICVHALEKNRRDKKQNEVWIFRQDNPPKIIHDYLVKEEDRLKAMSNMGRSTMGGTTIIGNKQKNYKRTEEQYTIGRTEHICCQKVNRFKKLPRVCEETEHKLLSAIMEEGVESYKQDPIEQQNTYLNKQMRRLSRIQGNEKYEKSQTMVFFQDFVTRNQQLANIIVKESQIIANQ